MGRGRGGFSCPHLHPKQVRSPVLDHKPVGVDGNGQVRAKMEVPTRRVIGDPRFLSAQTPQRADNLCIWLPSIRWTGQFALTQKKVELQRVFQGEWRCRASRVITPWKRPSEKVSPVTPNCILKISTHNHREVVSRRDSEPYHLATILDFAWSRQVLFSRLTQTSGSSVGRTYSLSEVLPDGLVGDTHSERDTSIWGIPNLVPRPPRRMCHF